MARDTVATLFAAGLGLVIGAFAAVMTGLALAHWRTLRAVLDPFLVALNSLPRPALAPILILWLGIGLAPKVLLSASLVFFIILQNILEGSDARDQDVLRIVRSMGASELQVTRYVTLPSLAGWVLAGFRTAASYALIGTVIGELVGSSSGLGYRLAFAAGVFQTNLAYGLLIWLMVLGVALHASGWVLERLWIPARRPALALRAY